uniref:F-box protein GID2 n=2 Tax=Nymphaea colorata TaxID=210225 RepID=A0A5K1BU10_9MAGN
MKRPSESTESEGSKRRRVDGEGDGEGEEEFLLDENLLFEVFRHMDSRTLGLASCVSRQWHRTAKDERLWEIICTRHWANTGCSTSQLRSVVLALGGFRRLHSLYLWPLLKPPARSSSSPSSSSSSSSSQSPSIPRLSTNMIPTSARWGKDEVHLSLSLLSIRYFEMMNPSSTHHRHLASGVVLQTPKRQLLEDSS